MGVIILKSWDRGIRSMLAEGKDRDRLRRSSSVV